MSDCDIREYERRLRSRKRTVEIDETEACFVRAGLAHFIRQEEQSLRVLEDPNEVRHMHLSDQQLDDLAQCSRSALRIMNGILAKLEYTEEGEY